MARDRMLSAREAAEALGVTLETLYAYVSRGQIRSEPGEGPSRARRYSAEDVARLKARKEQRRDPELAVQGALDWGTPVLESQLTLIENGRLYYRGHDAVELARSRSFEEVAALLWTGDFSAAPRFFGPAAEAKRIIVDALPERSLIGRFQTALVVAGDLDPVAWDLRPDSIAAAGARILGILSDALLPRCHRLPSLAARLAQGWAVAHPESATMLSTALILCADHELNVSSFTARCVASAGSTPYAVVAAGLAALQGHRHGGHTARVAALMREAAASEDPSAAIPGRLRRGEPVPGFGHPLYPQGDLRAKVLLQLAAEALPEAPAVRLATAVAASGRELLGEEPNLDFGLVTLAHALELPAEAPLALFALGRTAGWIAHAIEQTATGRLIRPRARYTGVLPATSLE